MDHHPTVYQGERPPYLSPAPFGQPLPDEGVRDLADILRRNLRLILGCTVLCVAAAVLYVVFARPSYRATASLRIDDRQPRIPALDVLGLSGGNEVGTEIEMLRSRMLVENVVDSLGLQLQITKPRRISREVVFSAIRVSRDALESKYTLTPAGRDGFVLQDAPTGIRLGRVVPGTAAKFGGVELQVSPAALGVGPITFSVTNFDDVVTSLQKTLSISRRNRDANLVDVGYRGPDPQLVQAVPNLLVTRFITDRQNMQQTETRSMAAFLREQTANLAGQLQAAEDRLKRFRESAHIISMPEQASSGVSRVAALQAQRNDLDAERLALAQLLRSAADSSADSSLRTPIAFPTLLRNAAAASLLSSLADAESRRSELLTRRSLQDYDVQLLTQRIQDLRAQLRGIASTYLQGLSNQIAAIDNTLARSNAELQTIPAKEIRLAELDRNVTGLEQIYTQLQSRLKESEIAEAAQDPSVRLVDAALLPHKPVSPRRALSLAVALVAGLIIGLSAALVREYLDRSVHTRQDVLAATGIPVLGVIPHGLGKSRVRRLPDLVYKQPRERSAGSRAEPFAPGSQEEIAEAFVRLAANVGFVRLDRPLQVLMVASALPGEGKTTSAVNLALTSAWRGAKVLLIDADLRRGTIHAMFGLPRTPGFSEILAGLESLEEAVQRVEVAAGPDLHVLTMGAVPKNTAQLFGSADLVGLFAKLRGAYDLIVIDSSPMNVVADATLLATHSDGVIVVARAGVTVPDALHFTLEQLSHLHVAVVGTVLNDMDYRRDSAYREAYQYNDSYLASHGK